MNWFQIKISTTTEAVEALYFKLDELGIKGIEIADPKDILMQDKEQSEWDYIEEELIKDLNEDEVFIKCYISEKQDIDKYKQDIEKAIAEVSEFLPIGKGTIEVNNVDEDDWSTKWKQYYKTFRLGNRLVIKPTWEEYEGTNDDDIIIEMDPGMAFGTGTHETTSMCMETIEGCLNKDDMVLDIGCGSGILSIGAAKLGAKSVIGVDIDVNAVKVAKENVEHNNVGDIVDIREGNLLDVVDDKADLIVANIIADVIIGMSDVVPKFLKDDGTFIASGIILDRLDDVLNALEAVGFKVVEKNIKGEWAAIVLKL